MIFKNTFLLIATSLLFLTSTNSCSENEDSETPNTSLEKAKTNCSNYSSQKEAQAAFDSDPEFYTKLDNDNDGRACEEPGNNVKPKPNCPKTANCGCSRKTKSSCGGACCKWVKGKGCNCN